MKNYKYRLIHLNCLWFLFGIPVFADWKNPANIFGQENKNVFENTCMEDELKQVSFMVHNLSENIGINIHVKIKPAASVALQNKLSDSSFSYKNLLPQLIHIPISLSQMHRMNDLLNVLNDFETIPAGDFLRIKTRLGELAAGLIDSSHRHGMPSLFSYSPSESPEERPENCYDVLNNETLPKGLKEDLNAFEIMKNDSANLEKAQGNMQVCPLCQETLATLFHEKATLVQVNCPGQHIFCEQCLLAGPSSNICGVCRGVIQSLPIRPAVPASETPGEDSSQETKGAEA